MLEDERIFKINIENEMKMAYIDYSMSVIVSRALPDVRDGMKPVQRRVLFGMNEMGNNSNKPHKKSANCVGEVMGKYHPHGDSSIYGTVCRMAQWWSLRHTLVDGHGNFGSIDGDSPAAMRYTEVRLDPLGEEMLRDIDEDTVDFQPNYDNSRKEPVVLPARFPNLLVNGSAGIAVGMATNMPPHNLTESINGCIALLDNPDMSIADLSKIIVAPDFPTGGIIYGYEGVREAYETGRGRVVIRAKAEIESKKEHDLIVVTEIPYGVNRAELIKSIAQLVIDKKIDGIANVNDESDREGMRIVVTLKSDANANVVLNKLYKLTAMQSSFAVNNVALVHGRPRTLNLKEIIQSFNEHRREVVLRRTRFQLKKAKDRAHILEGLMVAVRNIDEVVQIIKTSKTNEDAKSRLSARFGLTDVQTQAILEMRLRALTNLAVDDLQREIDEIHKRIADLQLILSDENVLRELIKSELSEVAAKFGDKRRTQINYAAGEFNAEDFYADDDMIITISHMGYIKRTPLAEFRAQNRGGVGARGSVTRDKDFIEHIYTASMHNTMLFFTDRGLVYKMPVYELPEGTRQTKGRALQNLLNIEPGDSVNAFIRCKGLDDPEYTSTHYLVFATRNGLIKKTVLSEYARVMSKGKKAILIREGDSLVGVELTDGNSQILVANRHGRAVRFDENELRAMGRVSSGVRGMKIDEDSEDAVVGLVVMPENSDTTVLVLSQKGFGKRSQLDGYRLTRRGARGVKTMNITEKTGELIAFKSVNDDNDLMIINKSGVVIRVHVSDIRVMGRATQGVRIINLEKRNDTIASVCCVEADPEEETEQIAPDAEELPALTDSETESEEDVTDDEIAEEEATEENE
ncbi:MAG: DNA gyrase subunit A [Muribaculaceae bacterium]|jgi:DNA gyrase subunit A|nr:DNA gyrase subunit A [Muribaculaceae bacterium]